MPFGRLIRRITNRSIGALRIIPRPLQNISVPVLITAMGAHYFIADSEQYYQNYAASHDKDFVTFFGLVHGITPCNAGVNCLPNVGPLANQVKNYWDDAFI